ncbi:DUF5998 family protein [Pseudactinotalea terrae]|uniref:DUF5998 family protein n=1 Tax=Pseudactinotalea terrae TaxID=1743262 RepID=UPI0012E315F6|nr:DUF5998 family protein [Pseudactinotalea terrae]
MPSSSSTALRRLRTDVERAGYYPDIVTDVIDLALAGEEVASHLVHVETMFDRAEVRRHVTVLVLTQTRLILAHVDDLPGEDADAIPAAAATTESVAIRHLRTVGLTHGVAEPASYRRGSAVSEVTLALSWGAVSRVELEPATCGDPSCEADHGFTGSMLPDDLVVRVSADAEGPAAVRAAIDFAAALSAATARV